MSSPDRSNPGPKVAAQQQSGSGVTRIPYPIGVRTVPVVNKVDVTPRMLRITLRGKDIGDLHSYQADDHVRVLLPEADGTVRAPVPNADGMLDWPKPHPPSRCYTIRRFDPVAHEIDLDFVRHDGGAAARLAQDAQIGDEWTLAGPPGAKVFPHHRDHYVFVVDYTAVPAVARWLEDRPETANATILALFADPTDQDYPLAVRSGDHLKWLPEVQQLAPYLDELDAAPDSFVFAAGEAAMVRAVRVWCKERNLDLLPTGYWKQGVGDFDD